MRYYNTVFVLLIEFLELKRGGEKMSKDNTLGINHNLLIPEESNKALSGVSSEMRTLRRRDKVEMSSEVKALLKLWL